MTGLARLDVDEGGGQRRISDQYDNRGDVMVRIVTFSGTRRLRGWQRLAEFANAKACDLQGLSAGGTVRTYDATDSSPTMGRSQTAPN